MKMTIACDLDGVLADIHTIVLTEVSAELGQTLTLNLYEHWDWLPMVYGSHRMELLTQCWVRYDPNAIRGHERDLEVITRKIRSRFHGLDVVTQHSELERGPIETWLRLHRVQYDRLVLVGLQDKTKLPYVAYIDDNPLMVPKIERSSKILYLYDQPWNQVIPNTLRNVKRVRCLREVLE